MPVPMQIDSGMGDVAGDKPSPVQEQFTLFQEVLNHLKLNPTIDRRDHPRDGSLSDITIVTMAEIEEALNVFLEGNNQCPDGVVFCLNSAWLSRQPSTTYKGLFTLYIHQGLTADKGGQTYLDKFTPPRKVTYFINHFLGSTTDGRRSEGEEMAKWDLETPCSSSIQLNYRVDNKLLTTLICAAAGQMYPVTLGFWLAGKNSPDYPETFPNITLVKLRSRNTNHDHIRAKVEEFVTSKAMRQYDQVVVKPFGPSWNSCKGVTYHSTEDIDSIMEAVFDLLNVVEAGTGILLQSFIYTLEPVVAFGLGRHAINTERMQLAFRVRAIVARTALNEARMTQVVCGINDINKPIGGVSTQPVSLDMCLRLWGITDASTRRDIFRAIRKTSEKLMLELMKQEEELTEEDRGGFGCQTDMCGMDFILTKRNDAITPVLIEVNAHDCLYQCTCYEVMHPQEFGYSSSAYVQIMLARSQRYQLENKVVLVVGAGGYSKRNLWSDAKKYGVKIVLVDSNPDHMAKDHVFSFLVYNLSDHTRDEEHAKGILKLLQETHPGLHMDGCLTFWEDCVPLAALMGEMLELHHLPSLQAARNAKSKMLTQQVLWSLSKEPPHGVPPKLYASPSIRIDSVDDLEKAVEQIPLPAIMKLEYGSSAVGVKLISEMEEAIELVEFVHRTFTTDEDHPGIGLGHGRTLILTQRLLGTEHDVDVVMFKGQLIAAFISDNGPTRIPLCMETAAVLPSVLHVEHQQQMISAAACCCRALGLHTGVYNVEMMMTPRGPRLIEINGRMGGFYLRDWIRYVYGVDLLQSALMCACNMRPLPTGPSCLHYPRPETVRDQLMGLMLYPSRHYNALNDLATPERLQAMHDESEVIVYNQLEEEIMPYKEGQQFEEPFANLAVKADSVDEAKAKLIALCVSLGLETEDDLKPILKDFIEPI